MGKHRLTQRGNTMYFLMVEKEDYQNPFYFFTTERYFSTDAKAES